MKHDSMTVNNSGKVTNAYTWTWT